MAEPLDAATLLSVIPTGLREPLFKRFNEIIRNFREGQWEPSELNGGKLCEVVYTILKGHIYGSYPSKPSKPRNMVDACRALEQAPASCSRSIRIQIPRMLVALYEVRNNRGVGHVGGDVDPNHMDAVAVLYMSKWIIAELIRVFHSVDTETATATVESIIERILPLVWKVGSKRRVLKTDLSMKGKTLVLLYQESGPVDEADIFSWVEYSDLSAYRRNILRSLHKDRLIEYDEETRLAHLSPKGIRYVEKSIDLSF